MSKPPALVVFSHLRWDFVFQRPQHLMTRLARTRPVFFVEEPTQTDGPPRWELREGPPGLTVCRPHTAARHAGFNDAQYPELRPLVRELVARAGGAYDLWFYTPMALPLADGLAPRVTVYDCMDELSAFQFAPPQLLELERRLLERADVVFTGGPSLYRAKKDRHANCHCFPSSVDAAHFGTAAGPLPEPAEQAALPRPRLGFFGVIDERFDRALLAAAAAARPDWQFVMVGPVVKIDPADLPRRPNVHFLGQRPYTDLPAFLAGWDVALLPFARNESTRYISPTKTVEYMAAGKPIVSTPIADVAEPYGAMVGLASTPEEFVVACERALAETPDARGRRLEQYKSVLAKTSWDATATLMADRIEACAERAAARTGGATPGRPPAAPVVVIGAGPTGLSAAYHLGGDALLLEANDAVGGWCRSLVDNGFTFDWAGHIMFSNDPYVHEMYGLLLGDNVHWQDREAWVYSKGVYTRYPFQGALYGLPADVITECILGAIEARFGSATQKPEPPKPLPAANGHGANGNGKHAKSGTCGLTPTADPKDAGVSDCCADGVAESTVPLAPRAGSGTGGEPTEPRNFEEFIYKVWGAGIAKHFAIPYNRKIWAVPLDTMETSWLGGRVPMPDLREMIEGALLPKPKPMGPNARFGYPLRGGFQALMDGFLPRLRGELRLNTRVRAVSPLRRVVTTTAGEEIGYERLVSTMPLPVLIRAMGGEAPERVRRAAEALRFTSVRCVNLGVGRASVTEKHWIYYPEDTVFHRIFVQGNASPHCNPPGGFGLTCEITYGPLKPLPCDGEELIRRCIADCVKVGIIDAADLIWAANQVDMPHAYVVYDHARPANVRLIREWLAGHGIQLAGRYSEWEYYNSDHAFLAGKKAADEARAALGSSALAPA
ncbi:FAD-dependent oxidoreductase [Gemmata sp. JC673]|uniref:FAD-dependent oxidoreductase n=1 Tax=Gemmata algarum TaxID=2975278 RepID=A0ABU5F2Y3_9BACT|nr:FAD-dependent oxidoreductase [Gemmata algarum]MDY3561925.1 FAD-dependent oxidoreductase [Gemmata algarum]